MIQILCQHGVALQLFIAALLGIERIDLLIELIALVIYLLELFIGRLCVVGLLVDSSQFALNPCEVLAHMEHGQVVRNEGEPLLVLLVLLLDDVIADSLESVVLDVQEVICGVLKALLNGLVEEADHISEKVDDLADDSGEGSIELFGPALELVTHSL